MAPSHRPWIIFDDADPWLAPLTDLRPSFDVRTGALTTVDRWTAVLGSAPAAVLTADRLAGLARETSGRVVNPDAASLPPGPIVFINGRWVAPDLSALALLTSTGDALVVGDSVAAIVAPSTGPGSADGSSRRDWRREVRRAVEPPAPIALLTRPWSVRTHRDACLATDLSHLAGSAPTAIHPSARVHPAAVIDAEDGPVVVAAGAVVRPGAILIGPCYLGPGSTVLERATIRPGTAIGPTCKVNGEVGGTIFQGLANKAHDGYLGDSWVGEWVNLGAGTTNSNLLNTYGEITARARPEGPTERTGEQFLGAIIGDHTKAAIGTRILTGAVIGTGVMWAATAPASGCVPAFSWVTDSGTRTYRSDKFIEVVRAAMARRRVEPTPACLARLKELLPRA